MMQQCVLTSGYCNYYHNNLQQDCNANHFGVPQRVNDMKMYETYEYHPSHHQIIQHTVPPPSPPPVDGEVLDLSRRCDSVETRKTPSPYNSPSSLDTTSPSTPCESPPNSGLRKTPTLVPTPVSVITSPLMLNEITSSVPRLYPFYHSNVKQEVITTPSSGAVPVNSSMVPYYSQSPHIMVPEPYYEPSSPPKYNNTSLEDHSKLNSPPPFQNENSKALYPNIINIATTGSANSIKATRPFNAYPRDPLLVAAHFAASDTLFEKASFERYTSYRKRALDNIHNTNGGPRVVTNPKMRRTNHRTSVNSEGEERSVESSDNDSCTGNSSSTEQTPKPTPSTTPAGNGTYTTSPRTTNNSGIVKDEAYYERRRKNNEAAKKSRDRRRIKEDEIAIRAAYLERQNIELLCQIDALKKQLKEISGNSASKDFQYSADRTTKS